MSSVLAFSVAALPISIMLVILFFSKKRMENMETKIYSFLLVSNLIGIIIDIGCTYAATIYNTDRLLSILILMDIMMPVMSGDICL